MKRSDLLRGVRRAHLYLGLFLSPWVLLFGLSALSFNHPTVGRGLRSIQVNEGELRAFSEFRPLDPELLAREVSSRVTAEAGGQKLSLVEGSARFFGWPIFARPSPLGQEVLVLNLQGRGATLTLRSAPRRLQQSWFSGRKLSLSEVDMHKWGTQLEGLYEYLNLPVEGSLRPHPEVHPELRFLVRDEDGQSHQVQFDLSTQELLARPTRGERFRSWVETIEALHTQHHYPANGGAGFYWALFADLLATTLIFWALSGLLMWWQLKKLRLIGLYFLILSSAVFSWVTFSTVDEQDFGVMRSEE